MGPIVRERERAALRGALFAFADLAWPLRCAGCDLPGVALCERCRAALRLIEREAACPRCGAPDGAAGCAECDGGERSYVAARCAGVLEWPLARLVTLHKDAGEMRFTPVLARLAADAAGEWTTWADAIVPVPGSPGALARRGFDHCAMLAAVLGVMTDLPALETLSGLPRRDQRHLSRDERARNAGSSIRAIPGASVPSHVLLLDDVMTTGATLDAAARALREAGAVEVRAVTAARACGGRL